MAADLCHDHFSILQNFGETTVCRDNCSETIVHRAEAQSLAGLSALGSDPDPSGV